MDKVRFGDVVKRVNIYVDRFNTDRLYYVGKGGSIEPDALDIKPQAKIEGATIGFKFHFGFEPGHILFMSRCFDQHKAATATFRGVCSDSTYVVETRDNNVLLQQYLQLVMQTDDFWNWCEEHKSGGVNFLINYSTLETYEFDLPSIEEQKVLADKLWAAYRVKESYRQLLSTTDEMLKAKFQEMFRTKETWQSMKLKDIVDPNCPISYGIVQPGEELEEGVPIVRPVDLNSELYVYRRGLKNTSETISNSYKRTILRGDELLMCVRGTTGVMGIATEELKGCNVTRGITPLFFKEGINRFYVLCVFLSDEIQQFIKDHTIGSTLKGINMSIVRDIDVPIATKEIQDEFERVFTQAEATKASLRSSIEAIDRVIRSLINQ